MSSISVSNIGFSIGEKKILSNIGFTVEGGGLVGLIGPNGAGKSTLARLIAGLTKPESGKIDLDGRPLQSIGRKALAREIAYMPQGHTVHWALEVYQVVALGRLPHLGPFASVSDEDAAAIEQAIDIADIRDFVDRDVTTLSGGERARVMLARALAVESPVLLVDEPIASLDPFHQIKVMHLLRSIAEQGRLVIAVLHDLSLAARFCDRLLLLGEGRLIADGMPRDVLNNLNLAETYAIEGLHGHNAGEDYVLPWRCLDRAKPVHNEEAHHAHRHS
ncbi:MAG: ABC transporter ATP-binding protein [Parvibaculum sp.]